MAEVDGASTGNDERLFRRLEMCNDRAQTELMMRRARMKTEKILWVTWEDRESILAALKNRKQKKNDKQAANSRRGGDGLWNRRRRRCRFAIDGPHTHWQKTSTQY